ncbi:metallophosphoesterase [Dehalococcoidia bacterium]|nr:metallophosphoesterase [Dehalococcoidia bacterium]
MWLVILIVVVLCLVLGGYTYFVEPRWLRLRRRVLYLDDWPPKLDGLTILHISDLHIRKTPTPPEHFLRRASKVAADLVVMTGDFVADPDGIDRCVEVLGPLIRDRVIYGVPGNHERAVYGPGMPLKKKFNVRRRLATAEIVEPLRRAGLTMLVNTSIKIPYNGTYLTLVGIDDMFNGAADVAKAFDGIELTNSVVLLSHSPDILPDAVKRTVALVLSGHTHGGQVAFPPFGTPTTATKISLERPSGVIRRGATTMHISPGLGVSFPPVRFLARPELTLLELRRTPNHQV